MKAAAAGTTATPAGTVAGADAVAGEPEPEAVADAALESEPAAATETVPPTKAAPAAI